jgi:2-polyprenyl-3-methyl-5-hydroxy-6-metoxy-1,4-benzoquinol methylase
MKQLVPVVLVCSAVFGQVAAEANRDYQTQETRGKIVSGLQAESRNARQRPKELVAALGIRQGMTVADIGSGGGYMLPYLSEAVGPGGRVYAEDIFPDFLQAAKKHAAKAPNITYILGDEKSAKLPADSHDVILVLDAYHHFNYPDAMLANLREALKPDGRLVVVEYHRNDKSMPNGRALGHIRATREEFVKEIEAQGFRAVEVRDFTPEVQWMGVFQRR